MRSSIHATFGLIMLFGWCLSPGNAYSQNDNTPKRIEILNANTLEYKEIKGEKVRKLIGEVKFRQKGVTMDCDSAHQYQERNLIKAYNNIHLRQGDSIHLTGKFLRYDGNTRKAIIKREVVLKDDAITLRTDTLHYEMGTSRGYYKNGGVIRDSVNKLTSVKGFYHAKTDNLFFRDSVRLHNPDYTIYCDTLRYQTESEKAFFYGPTDIISDSNHLYCENGWYDTRNNLARFGANTYLRSAPYTLYADSLFYDRERQYGRARFDIRLVDTSRNLVIEGQKGEYYENHKPSYITDSTLARKVHKEDTLYLHADTLKSAYDTAGNRILKAYYGAKTFERAFQSQADSLVYRLSDSSIYFYNSPVLWYHSYQLTGGQVQIKTDGAGKAEKMVISYDAMIISRQDETRFNQVKGRKMTGHFMENELKTIFVEENAEAIYYLTDEEDKFLGVNKIQSSDLRIALKDRAIEKITFLEKPDATVYPPDPQNQSQFRFSGFRWLSSQRPGSVAALFTPFEEGQQSEPATKKTSPQTEEAFDIEKK